MRGARLVFEVARWEFLRLFKWKDVIGTLAFAVVLGLLFSAGKALMMRAVDEKKARVAVLDGEALPLRVAPEGGIELVPAGGRDAEALSAAVGRGELDGLLVLRGTDEAELLVAKRPRWEQELVEALSAARREVRLSASGLSPEALAEILAPVRLDVRYHETSGRPVDWGAVIAVGAVVGLMLMAIFFGSTYLLIGITGEKQLRVTEQVVSAISPQTWIDGKILGHSAMALVSVVNLTASALLTNVVLSMLGNGVTLPSVAANPFLLLLIVVFALLGFFLWFTFYAAVAATVDDPNTSSRSVLLFLPFLPLGLAALALLKDPDTWPFKLLGVFPLTSPSMMPVRLCLTDVAAWEVALAAALLVGSIWLARRVAGKIFAVGILMYGKELSLAEVWRWSRDA